ncbi:MAG: DUF983 domain-containing protein [Dehalococcoidia bacterium]
MASWFQMRENCRSCGLRMERHVGFMTGSMTLSYIVGEGLVVLIGVLIFALTWPEPPWMVMLAVLLVLAVVSPIAFFPFSKTLWLVFDLLIRPVEPWELESPDEPSH